MQPSSSEEAEDTSGRIRSKKNTSSDRVPRQHRAGFLDEHETLSLYILWSWCLDECMTGGAVIAAIDTSQDSRQWEKRHENKLSPFQSNGIQRESKLLPPPQFDSLAGLAIELQKTNRLTEQKLELQTKKEVNRWKRISPLHKDTYLNACIRPHNIIPTEPTEFFKQFINANNPAEVHTMLMHTFQDKNVYFRIRLCTALHNCIFAAEDETTRGN
mmetsp:Transcript_48925/g.59179  ORF Transcript_48925/g.59179 Transcript_48925/m.59179 type:complete len:215 (-) Transcript_48925:388-1032(-)